MEIREAFGNIDIYLFDQLLKDRFDPSMSILDAGCGGGRNLHYFFRNGYKVFAIDGDPQSVAQVRRLAASLAPELPQENFRIADVAAMPFADGQFDAVISSAVLHFAPDEQHFHKMLDEMWRVLKPGGLLFARLASSIGIENHVQLISERRFLLPDGTERFLVDEMFLYMATERLGGIWL